MPINSRQFDLLSQMGVALWQSKLPFSPQNKPLTPNNISPSNKIITNQDEQTLSSSMPAEPVVTFEQLNELTFFNDILHYLKLSLGEVSIDNGLIKLQLLNWQIANRDDIIIEQHIIHTPPLAHIQQSSSLKRQLWQQLIQHKI